MRKEEGRRKRNGKNRKIKRRSQSENARLTLDLGIGIAIFFFTFMFISQFIPSVFADVRSEISLANQAYRVAALLAEDPGVYENKTSGISGHEWEKLSADQLCSPELVFRPGFANFSFEDGIKYNELSRNKVERFFEVFESCPEKVKEGLGLNLTKLGGTGKYSLRVVVSNISGGECIEGGTNQGGEQLPLIGQVIKYERIVQIYMNSERRICKLEVFVWQ